MIRRRDATRRFIAAVTIGCVLLATGRAQEPLGYPRLPVPPAARQPWQLTMAADQDAAATPAASMWRLPSTELPDLGSSSTHNSLSVLEPATAPWATGMTPAATLDTAVVTQPQADCGELRAPYRNRAMLLPDQDDISDPENQLPTLPPDYAPWWQQGVSQPLRKGPGSQPVDVRSLVLQALGYSQNVRAILDRPLIRETAILEAAAEFDGRAFMESKFVKTSEPVGDTLTTGGPPRFRESDWGYTAGVRKKTRLGGRLELSQRLGYRDNNSLFFVPTQQGNARLTLSFEQPLLNGAGKAYNTSLIVLAELDTAGAWDETSAALQEHLLEVTRAYWRLHLQRSTLLQMQKLHQQAVVILDELEHRRGVDALHSQIARARAAVATRGAELVRSAAAIRNAEARLRALINSPQLTQGWLELVPHQHPATQFLPISLRDASLTALDHRPEVARALKELDAAAVRLKMSKNELLPSLSVVLETYVSGLEGRSAVGQAWKNQFGEGEPSYSAGLVFEVPFYNRAANSRYDRRQLELRELTHQFRATVELLMAEVEVAVREVNTSFRELRSKFTAMVAAQADVDYMTQRWRLLPGDDRAASFLLEDLLDAQDRLAEGEFGFADAGVSYAVALADLKRVTGILLQTEQITPQVLQQCGLPSVQLHAYGQLPAAEIPGPELVAPGMPSDPARYPVPR